MKRLLPLLLASAFSAAVAAPTAPVVVNGTATFSQQGNVFTITNTPNTIINWQTFSIAPGEVTRFVQQSATSAVLNRIVGQDPSQILGALQSNGQVFLINPNGVMFGQGSRIDVAGLTASTLNMADADFLAGRNKFSAGPVAGNVSNHGAITTASGGHVFLIAPIVENNGIITSPQGDVVLAAGRQVQLVDSRDPDVHVVVSAPEDKAVNLGQVISHGGRIGIYGGLVNQRGAVNANSAVVGLNGKIVLKASGDTLLEAGSTTTATGAGTGGSVHVLGNRVGMTGNASIDVSGANGGGTVLMGGDYRGQNPLYASAQHTLMGKDASIKADATFMGKGGKVILWALGATRAFGTISAQGGAAGGNGGFVETSAEYLDVNGIRVDTRALNGATGLWLLDPNNIRVGLPGDNEVPLSKFEAEDFNVLPEANGYISATTLLAASSHIVLEAKNNITFNDALNNGAYDITARAGGSINVDAPMTTTGGNILLQAADPSAGIASSGGAVNVNNTIQSGDGNITLAGAAITIGAAGSVTTAGTGHINLTADQISIGNHVTAGQVSGTNLITIMPYTPNRNIWIANALPSGYTGPGMLHLTNNDLGFLHASQVRIGSENAGDISWGLAGIFSPAGMRTLSLRTPGTINIDNLAEVQDATGHIELHAGAVNISGSGWVKAPNVTLRADQLSVGGYVDAADKISVLPSSSTKDIRIGGEAVDSSYTLALSNYELTKLRTAHLSIAGAELSGNISVEHTTYANATNSTLTLDAGRGGLHLDGSLTTSGKLVLKAGESGIHQSPLSGSTDSRIITTPHLHIEGDAGGVSAYLAHDSNAVGILTATNLADLHFINGGNLVVGDGTNGIAFANVPEPYLQIASAGSVTVQNNIDARNGWISLEGAAVQVGLAVDGNGVSTGTSNAFVKAGGLDVETMSFSMSKGTGMQADHVTIETDKFQLEQGALVTTGAAGSVSITPYTHLATIALGAGAQDLAGSETVKPTLGLNEIELQALDTHSLSIGDYIEGEPGLVSVVGSLDLTASPNLRSTSIYLGAAGMHIRNTGALRVPYSLDITGANASVEAGHVLVDGLLEATGTSTHLDGTSYEDGMISIEAQSVRGAGLIKASFASLMAIDGIGTDATPLKTQLGGLWAQNALYNASAPINIKNNGGASAPLVISGLHQYGDGSGTIRLENSGPLFVANDDVDVTVSSKSGSVTLVSDDTLSVDGLVQTTTGAISLESGAVSDLTVTTAGAVRSDSGNIMLRAGGAIITDGIVSTTTGTITREAGTIVTPPPPPPSLAECLANPAISGCTTVLDAGLDSCIADQTGTYCSQLLPTIEACIANESQKGCSVVLPTISQCLADRNLQGCSVVLPTTSECAENPSQPGCVTSLPPTLEACIANPSISGCDTVLPSLAQCIADSSAPGCEVILPDLAQCVADKSMPGCEAVLPDLAACIADRTAAGCQVVLPSLAQCVADKAMPGCEVVLPTIAVCVADKTAPGCEAVLPNLAVCIADKTVPGCEAVLPNLAVCIADKTAPGCEAVLPNLAACIADKTAPGCEAVLPNLTACIADKTSPGCEVVLPAIAACVANRTLPGCEAVLPAMEVCVADKTAPGCVVVLPTLSACVADKTSPGCEVVLPSLAACVADSASPGCEVVLPTLAMCIANKASAGCEVVLPNLAVCIADKTSAGCEVVLPNLAACVADKATPGCQVVLPALEACIANKTSPGCQVVLPQITSCIADPTQGGCEVVLPTLAACVVDKTSLGCQVVLPTLAECTTSPSLGGCSVVLPKLEQCAANPNLQGCVAVLPKPDFCSTHPTDPSCVVFNPAPTSQEKTPVTQAVETTVTLINTSVKPVQNPGLSAGQAQGQQQPDAEKKLEEKDQQTPAPAETTGAKNEKPATKTYCN